ncbi:MAG: hypothetical protein M3R05_04575 [Chloroflexota bacterium]|nr:hypothetical protein [Chloroflexota bacterium]
MEWLVGDRAQPVLGVAGLTLAGLLGVGAVVLRRRADRFQGSVLSVFLSDAGTVLAVLAVTVGLVSAALAAGVEGVGRPLWLVIAVTGSAVAGGLLIWRWRGEVATQARRHRPVTPTGAPERRIVSSAWEIAIVSAGLAGLLTYIGTADHRFGHPLHWILAVVGLLLGYALGIGAVTPRFRLESPTRKS